MKNINAQTTGLKLRRLLRVFIILLVLSGVTAFPLQTELSILHGILINCSIGFLRDWIAVINNGLQTTANTFPFLFYGTDWLAFAHIVIAVAFFGPIEDPVRNIWVIKFGMIACKMVPVFAFLCGLIRGIPIWWQLIDCSFGVFGFIVLHKCYQYAVALESLSSNNNN